MTMIAGRSDIATDPGILLTGGTGFLGGEILARLLERDDRPVYLLIRAPSERAAAARLRKTLTSLLGAAEPWSQRVTAVAADLTKPGLAMSAARRRWLAERTESIIHCAASVSFTLGLSESRAINVAGTSRLLDLAALCAFRGGLECFTHVSTAYVAGTHRGCFTERNLDLSQDFRNPYERTKFEAETLVLKRSRSLPVQVLRPSIVVGDSRTGWTPSFNVLYWPLRAFARGAYPAIPAKRSAPADVVPVDYVADAVLGLAGRPGTTYHLTAGGRTSSVGEVIDLAADYLRRPSPRVISPAVYRRTVHPLLLRSATEARRRALNHSEAFFPYFAIDTHYDDALAREALSVQGIEAPPLGSYFSTLMDFALQADWGRRPVRRVHRPVVPASARDAPPRLAAQPRDSLLSTGSLGSSIRS